MTYPPAGWPLRLDLARDGDDRLAWSGLPSRVEEAAGEALLVAAPRDAPADLARPGAAVSVRWSDGRGLHSAPMALRELVPGARPRWHLLRAGDVEVVQRRRHVRVAYVSSACLIPRVERLNAVAGGVVADLSEGGVRVLLVSRLRVGEGDEATVLLEVDGQPLELPGETLRCTTVQGPAPYAAAVRFLEPVPHAELLRRAVLRRSLDVARGRG